MSTPTTKTARSPEWREAEPFVFLAMAGNTAAFDEVVRLVQRQVRGYIALTSHGLERHVDDMAQDTFLRAFLKVGSLRDPAAFQSWLLTIAHNVVMEAARREGRLPLEDEPSEDAVAVASDGDIDLVDRVALHSSLHTIKREYAAVLVLLYLYDLSYEEAAEVLGCTVGTIGSRRARGIVALRELYQVPGGDLDG